MEDGEQPALQHRLEVDHDVAAANEVELAERRVGKHVVRREHDHAADLFGDVVLVVALDEEPREALGRHVVDDAFREHALAGLLDSARVDVRRENLHVALDLEFVEHFLEQDRNRVRLLARGAARAPHADGLVLARVLHDVVDRVALEHLEELRVAEEARHADEDLFRKHVDLLGVAVEGPRVVRERLAVRHDDAAFDAAQHGRALVVGEVDAALLFEQQVDMREALLVGEQLVACLRQDIEVVVREVQDLVGDLMRRRRTWRSRASAR